jgi:hypothetical protein
MWQSVQPHGRPYNMWQGDYASGFLGTMVGCHVAVGKFPMKARKQIFKNKKRPTKSGRSPAKSDGQNFDSEKSKQQLQTWWRFQTTYILS